MWLMLQQEKPEDFVIATGETYSVRQFLEKVFNYLKLNWQRYVKIDRRYFRPTEVEMLQGDATKAKEKLSWRPRVRIDELVQRMVDHDFELARQERTLTDAGHVFWLRGKASQ
jgi:GDPmannose 4,6-dehydratase